MLKHLEFLDLIYNQNRTCVSPLLDKFLYFYEEPVKKLISTLEKLKNHSVKNLAKNLRYITREFIKLNGVSNQMKKCSSEIDTNGCIENFVGFDCRKPRSGCGPVYKSFLITHSKFKGIEELFNFYENSFDSFIDDVAKADE